MDRYPDVPLPQPGINYNTRSSSNGCTSNRNTTSGEQRFPLYRPQPDMLYQQMRRPLILRGVVPAAGRSGADGCCRGRRRDKGARVLVLMFLKGDAVELSCSNAFYPGGSRAPRR